jgi:hypothetical protein
MTVSRSLIQLANDRARNIWFQRQPELKLAFATGSAEGLYCNLPAHSRDPAVAVRRHASATARGDVETECTIGTTRMGAHARSSAYEEQVCAVDTVHQHSPTV